MATLASRTKELSGLHSGTLAAHLLAITQGGGRTVFASRMTVNLSEPRFTLVQRAKRDAAPTPSLAAPARAPTKKRRDVSVLTTDNRVDIQTTPETLYLVSGLATRSVTIRTVDNTVTVKRSSVLEAG